MAFSGPSAKRLEVVLSHVILSISFCMNSQHLEIHNGVELYHVGTKAYKLKKHTIAEQNLVTFNFSTYLLGL